MRADVLGLKPSFGFGDRLGLATPGHVEALRRSGSPICGIFPQQSIREMTRTGRTATGVMQDAVSALEKEQWTEPFGADADHLKTPADIALTAEAGFTFFTLDPSAEVDPQADQDSEAVLRSKLAARPESGLWIDEYRGRTVGLSTGTSIELTEEACLRAAVKYGRAILLAISLGQEVRRVMEINVSPFEIELSIDETDHPTSLAEHWIIADQCFRNGVPLISLAPRFVGDFEKGVDFKGDHARLEASLNDHAAIASVLGPYKLSLHSGSDKLSMYSALATATRGLFHVKTAGTSYLEALRVVCHHEPAAFRELVSYCRYRYEVDRATYHVSARLADVPAPEQVREATRLEQLYLERWQDVPAGRGFTAPGRQILHCTFGSVLTHPDWGPLVKQTLASHPDTYRAFLADHFVRHLEMLKF